MCHATASVHSFTLFSSSITDVTFLFFCGAFSHMPRSKKRHLKPTDPGRQALRFKGFIRSAIFSRARSPFFPVCFFEAGWRVLLLLPNFHTSTIASRQEENPTGSDKQASIMVQKICVLVSLRRKFQRHPHAHHETFSSIFSYFTPRLRFFHMHRSKKRIPYWWA